MHDRTPADRRAAIFFYAIRFFYGGWFLFHGLNWWLHYFPERSFAPDAHGLIPELIRLGLFDLVKILEVVIGLALLADLFVPLAVVAAFPLTIVIAYVNVTHHTVFGVVVGVAIIALNGAMAIGHLDRYAPMLTMRAGQPGIAGLAAWRQPRATPQKASRLSPRMHAMAILLGIAAPAAITYASILFANSPTVAAPQ